MGDRGGRRWVGMAVGVGGIIPGSPHPQVERANEGPQGVRNLNANKIFFRLEPFCNQMAFLLTSEVKKY